MEEHGWQTGRRPREARQRARPARATGPAAAAIRRRRRRRRDSRKEGQGSSHTGGGPSRFVQQSRPRRRLSRVTQVLWDNGASKIIVGQIFRPRDYYGG